MEKYIGFDIDSKKIICCVVQQGKKDRYRTISSKIPICTVHFHFRSLTLRGANNLCRL